jgi:hypothetical protein
LAFEVGSSHHFNHIILHRHLHLHRNHSQPELQLILPRQVRIAQGIETGPYLYLQPVIVSSGQSERSEVILDMMVREI